MVKDAVLKKIFADPEMVELLVRRCRPELAGQIDFSTLRDEPTELVSGRLARRFADMLFTADRRGERRKVLFHLEFQATVDPDMAPRIMAYAGLALQKLRDQSPELRRDGALLVVSIVLYHGKGRWTAPVPAELSPGLVECVLIEPAAVGLAEVRAEHIPEIVLGLLVPDQTYAAMVRTIGLLDRILHRGVGPRLHERIRKYAGLVLDFHYPHPVFKEARALSPMVDVLAEARRMERADARQEGRQEANVQLIVHLVGRRFGSATAQRVSRLLAGVTDLERMKRVAEAVVECADGHQFLADVRPLLEGEQA